MNIISTPFLRKKIEKMRRELFWLRLKEKLLGPLSPADEQRKRDLIFQLSIRY